MYPAFTILLLGPIVVVAGGLCWVVLIRLVSREIRRHPKKIAVAFLIYVGSYALLSMNGEYALANHGGQHWTRSWCPPHVIEQNTGLVGRSKIRPTYLALAYWPLVVGDMWLWHPALEPWEGYDSW